MPTFYLLPPTYYSPGPYHTILTAQNSLYQQWPDADRTLTLALTLALALALALTLTLTSPNPHPNCSRWQTKIFYYHFRRVQREGPHGGRCTELTGFTR